MSAQNAAAARIAAATVVETPKRKRAFMAAPSFSSYNGSGEEETACWRLDPSESFSDWKIVVQEAALHHNDENNTTSSSSEYHVHKYFLALGPRKCDYFACLLPRTPTVSTDMKRRRMSHIVDGALEETRTETTRLTLEASEAAVFPIFLDYIYSSPQTLQELLDNMYNPPKQEEEEEPPAETAVEAAHRAGLKKQAADAAKLAAEKASTEAMVPLRHLGNYFGLKSLVEEVDLFMENDVFNTTKPAEGNLNHVDTYFTEALVYHDADVMEFCMKNLSMFARKDIINATKHDDNDDETKNDDNDRNSNNQAPEGVGNSNQNNQNAERNERSTKTATPLAPVLRVWELLTPEQQIVVLRDALEWTMEELQEANAKNDRKDRRLKHYQNELKQHATRNASLINRLRAAEARAAQAAAAPGPSVPPGLGAPPNPPGGLQARLRNLARQEEIRIEWEAVRGRAMEAGLGRPRGPALRVVEPPEPAARPVAAAGVNVNPANPNPPAENANGNGNGANNANENAHAGNADANNNANPPPREVNPPVENNNANPVANNANENANNVEGNADVNHVNENAEANNADANNDAADVSNAQQNEGEGNGVNPPGDAANPPVAVLPAAAVLADPDVVVVAVDPSSVHVDGIDDEPAQAPENDAIMNEGNNNNNNAEGESNDQLMDIEGNASNDANPAADADPVDANAIEANPADADANAMEANLADPDALAANPADPNAMDEDHGSG